MQFPNAAKGIKLIFTAEILALIASIAATVGGGIMAAMGSANSQGAETTAVIIGGVALVAGVLVLIAFIMNLVGLNAARKDDQFFKMAFILTLVGIVIAIAQSIFANNTTVTSLLDTFTSVCEMFITIYVCKGIMSLAEQLGKKSMVERGSKVIKMVVAVWIISIVAGFIGSIFSNNDNMLAVAGILILVAGIVSIIAYFIYLGYLSRAKKMLN